jgi:hypothetical protein
MNSNQFFIDQKIQHGIAKLEHASAQVARCTDLSELTRLMSHIHADHLVKSLSIVRQAAYRLRTVAEIRAEELTAPLLRAFSLDPDRMLTRIREAYRVCCGIFPKQAELLRRALTTVRSSNPLSNAAGAATDPA